MIRKGATGLAPAERGELGGSGGARVAGVVPAAGASRRMGRPKALLALRGEPFVHHAVRTLVEGGCAPVLVVVAEEGRADGTGARIAAAARAAGARVLGNPDPGEGPITSIRCALRTLAGDEAPRYLAILPVDHPSVAPATVAALARTAASTGAPLVLPVHRGARGHPALIGRALFPELEDPALEGGARTVVHRHLARAALVETSDAGVLLDVDTPEAYAALAEGAAPPPDADAPRGEPA